MSKKKKKKEPSASTAAEAAVEKDEQEADSDDQEESNESHAAQAHGEGHGHGGHDPLEDDRPRNGLIAFITLITCITLVAFIIFVRELFNSWGHDELQRKVLSVQSEQLKELRADEKAKLTKYRKLLVAELSALGAVDPKPARGGVRFGGALELAYRACLWSRTASRVLLPLFEFPVTEAEGTNEGEGGDQPGGDQDRNPDGGPLQPVPDRRRYIANNMQSCLWCCRSNTHITTRLKQTHG